MFSRPCGLTVRTERSRAELELRVNYLTRGALVDRQMMFLIINEAPLL